MLSRREFITMTAGTVVAGCMGGMHRRPAGPPNMVLLLTDDQGWSQLSTRMDPDIANSFSTYLETPNMARMAQNGVRFTSGYAPAPLCTPTRRSIQCGMTTAREKGTEFPSEFVPSDHMTIPRALKQANPAYRCAHFGKWGTMMNAHPEACGYDATDGETSNHTGGMPSDFVERSKVYIDPDSKRTPSLTARSIDFMREQVDSGHTFYLQVSYYAVHLAVEVFEKTLRKYEAKGTPDRGYTEAFAAMLEDLDTGIGQLLDALVELGIDDNTYVVFMSDNGGRGTIPGGDESRLPTNHPLMGAKHSLYEGGLRVPFIVCGPGVPPGSVCDVPVVGYDLLPTFYDLARGQTPLPDTIDGGSFKSLLFHPESGSVERYLNALVFHRPMQGWSTIRCGDYKLHIRWTRESTVGSRALYDLASDPYEKQNLAETDAATADRLEDMLLGYFDDVDARTPLDFLQPNRKKTKLRKS